MSSNVISQFLSGTTMMVGTSTAIGFAAYHIKPEWFGKFPHIDIYATSKATVSNKSAANDTSSVSSENLKCDLEKNISDNKFDCKLHTTTSSDYSTKKHLSISSFEKEITEQTSIQVDKYYKIHVSKKLWLDWYKFKNKKIEIYKGTAKASNDLIPLFAIENGQIIGNKFDQDKSNKPKKYFIGTTKQITGKSSDSKTSSTNTEIIKSKDKNYKCIYWFFASYDCKVYDFASTEIAEITEIKALTANFHHTTTVKEKITNDKFYLFELDYAPEKIMGHDDKNKSFKINNTKPAIYIDQMLFIIW